MSATDPAIATILRDSEALQATPAVRPAVLNGLLFSVTGIYLAAVGLLLMLHGRAIVVGVMPLGEATLLALGLGAGFLAARQAETVGMRVVQGIAAGAIAGSVVALLPVVMKAVSMRWIFIWLSPALSQMLTFTMGPWDGAPLMLAAGAVTGMVGALLPLIPALVRRLLIAGCGTVVIAGVFQQLIQIMLQTPETLGTINDLLFTWEGLSLQGATIIFVAAAVMALGWSGIARRQRNDPAAPLWSVDPGRSGPAGADPDATCCRGVYRPGHDAGWVVHP
jgi:branched-chain amino acid transport system permease protein